MLSWILLFCLATIAHAQNWIVTGSLTYARYDHTATLLPNGNVLVAAGYNSPNYLNSAELYNPTTGLWTVTGNLTYTRYDHTATLLPDGNVLIAGGLGKTGYLNSAELYNPTTGVWNVTGFVTYARAQHTTTLLPNGNVLVAGGALSLNSAELYNATTSVWTVTGSLNTARFYHTATLLLNGNVLVAGGEYYYVNEYIVLNSAEVYNATTGLWTVTGSLAYTRYEHTATLLNNGNVLVAGGCCYLNSAELYNATTGLWTVTGSLTYTRDQHTSTLLPNGMVLVAGGEGSDLNSAELYITTNPTALPACCSVSQGLYSEETISSSLQVNCFNCSSAFTAFGNFSNVIFYNFALISKINLTCTNCSGLVTFGVANTQTTLPLIMLACTNCPSLQSLGDFSQATSIASSSLSCTNCPLVQSLGDFSHATSIGSSLSLSCTNCPLVQSLGEFTSLTTSPQVTLSCFTCSSLESFGNFPSLISASSQISISCTDCFSLIVLGSFPLLTVSVWIELTCSTCPAIAISFFPSLPINQLASLITFTCVNCPSLSFSVASLVFVFTGSVPSNLTISAQSASLSFFNAILPAAFTIVDLVQAQSLSFVNVSGIQNLDFLFSLVHVDTSLTIDNTTFVNIDGSTANLAFVENVIVKDNPVLCNIETSRFQSVSVNAPTITNNGFSTTCILLEPVAPKLSLLSRGTYTIQISWILPTQPSILTTYSLTENGDTIVTFPSWNPVGVPYTVTSLSASTTYVFVLIATLGALIVSSPPLTVITDSSASSGCLSGYYKPSGSCLPCGVAQYPSNDFLSCVSCSSGTYANTSALASSASCLLCPSGTYASSSQSTRCSSCPSLNYCPFGAAAALSSAIFASPANETSTSSSASSGLSLGYIYLIVFFVLAFVTGLVVVIFPKRMRSVVLKFAVVIRTPRFLFRVNPSNWRILELPSVIRGLIGFWVLLGLILVTIYQINNFIVNQFGSSSYIQPGTKFSSGQPILSATTIINVTVVLFASPITCDPSLFATSSTLNGVVSCTSNATTTTFTLTTPLSSLPSSATNLQLTITAANDNLAYAPALQYSFTSLGYNNLNDSVTETIVGGSNTVVTGTSTINIAAVATESLDVNGVTLNTGYDFSYISTSASTSNLPSSSLVLSFQLSVPQYFLQVRQVVAITPLVFLSGLLAIGGGVIAVGTLIAFFISYAAHHWLKTGAGRQDGSAIELVKSGKQDPRWF